MTTALQLRNAGAYVPPHVQNHDHVTPHQLAGSRPMVKLYCVHCLKAFESAAANREYCTPKCQRDYAKAERDFKRTRQADYGWMKRPSSGGHVFDLGLQEDRFR